MTPNELITWRTLQLLKIDDETSMFAFSDRLARENSWTKQYALGAIEEYKKFVFLAKHAGHKVTPSIEVDEVWHLHMIYTRSYWNDMCKTINFDLHHGPTKGGKAEGDKFNDWYSKTLESYKTYFGEPPSQYWPSNEKRFAPNTIKKIDTKKFFIFKKPSFNLSLICISPLFLLFTLTPGRGLLIIGGILLFFYLLSKWLNRNDKNNGSGGCGSSSNSGWFGSSCGSGCGSDSGGHSGCGSSGCGSSGCSSCGGCGGD